MRKYWGYIVGFFGAITALVFYLFGQNRELKDKVGELEGGAKLREELSKKDEAENEANSAEDHYKSIRDQYLNESDGDGSKS